MRHSIKENENRVVVNVEKEKRNEKKKKKTNDKVKKKCLFQESLYNIL